MLELSLKQADFVCLEKVFFKTNKYIRQGNIQVFYHPFIIINTLQQ